MEGTMTKFIDAEQLSEKIESISLYTQKSADYNDGRDDMKMMVLDLLDSLQQEQPEVDLDFQSFAKEMDSIFALPKDMTGNTEENPLNWEYVIARHFYQLGLNARKEG